MSPAQLSGSEPRDGRRRPFRMLTPPRWLPDKVTTLEQAVGSIADGDTVALGGMTLQRRPVAACAEVIRQGRRGLTLVDYTGSFEGDILIGSGCVTTVRSCYFGMDILGLAPMHRAFVASGRVKTIEETEATVAYGLRAARMNVDFLPARIWNRTDLPMTRPDLYTITSPYSGADYIAIPALVPDVAIIHAWIADPTGNAVLRSDHCLDADLAVVARKTILTAERVVSTSEVENHEADVLGGFVDHVVEARNGAWPTSCFPDYATDLEVLAQYVEECAEDGFDDFLERHLT